MVTEKPCPGCGERRLLSATPKEGRIVEDAAGREWHWRCAAEALSRVESTATAKEGA